MSFGFPSSKPSAERPTRFWKFVRFGLYEYRDRDGTTVLGQVSRFLNTSKWEATAGAENLGSQFADVDVAEAAVEKALARQRAAGVGAVRQPGEDG